MKWGRTLLSHSIRLIEGFCETKPSKEFKTGIVEGPLSKEVVALGFSSMWIKQNEDGFWSKSQLETMGDRRAASERHRLTNQGKKQLELQPDANCADKVRI